MSDEEEVKRKLPHSCGECLHRRHKLCLNPRSFRCFERVHKDSIVCELGESKYESTSDNGFSAEDKRIMNEGERDIRRIVASGEHDRTVFDLSEIREGDVVKTANKIFTCHESGEKPSERCLHCCFFSQKGMVLRAVSSNLCYMCSEGMSIYFTQQERPDAVVR